MNLNYFGLLPEAMGRGLGRYMLAAAVDEVFAGPTGPAGLAGLRGMTVNTCTADHARALPNYLAAGFVETRRVREVWDIPAASASPSPTTSASDPGPEPSSRPPSSCRRRPASTTCVRSAAHPVRDNRYLIIDKPAGLPVHPGRAGGTGSPSVEDFFPLWRTGKTGPWLAHRLDRDTAGCLLIALKKSALLAAQALFTNGAVEKTYWALVHGTPVAASGIIDQPLAKQTVGRNWKMAPAPTHPPPAPNGASAAPRLASPGWNSARAPAARTNSVPIARISAIPFSAT